MGKVAVRFFGLQVKAEQALQGCQPHLSVSVNQHIRNGYWAEGYEAQLIFFDPTELAAVVNDQMETWEPQPYAVMSIQDVLYDPNLNFGEYRRDLLGGAAFDRYNGILYIIERLTDEYKSVVHAWKLQ